MFSIPIEMRSDDSTWYALPHAIPLSGWSRWEQRDTVRAGRNAGEFHYVHVAKFDSRGNLYTGEVDTGKRLQKWVPVE